MWIYSKGLKEFLITNNCNPIHGNYFVKNDKLLGLIEKYEIYSCFRNKQW
jgi:hypothetical protein